jgi:hypothetical protein
MGLRTGYTEATTNTGFMEVHMTWSKTCKCIPLGTFAEEIKNLDS